MKNPLRPPSVALAALACGVAASLFAWYLAGRQAQARNDSELAGRAQLAGNLLERRIQRYVDMLYGLEAFAGQRNAALEREEFQQFAQALELGNRFPGVQAVEFVRRVDHRDRIALDIHPPGERDEYWVVDYIEPMAGNEAALGLDIRARSTAVAAERARDLGAAEMTARYRLVQETGESFGLVIYLPVYGLPEPLSAGARREALKGFVNVVLRVDDVMAAMLTEPVLEGMDFWAHDLGEVGGTAQPVSQGTRFYATRDGPPAPERWHEWRPATDLALQVAGRQWLLRLQQPPLRNPWLTPMPLATLGAGVAMSLLLFGILLTVARSRSEAVAAAAHATHELRTQLSFTQQLIEAIPNPVFFKDAAGRYLGCNQAFEQYVSLPRAQLIGRTVFDIMPPDFADRSQVFDRELIGRPGTQAYEAQLPGPGGGRRDVIVNKATFFDPNGEVAGLVGVIVDITQRKQLEASTRDSNERLRAIIEASPMAIVARDLDSLVRMWNPAAERLFGWKEEEVLETATSIVPEHLREEVARLRARAEHGETIWIEDTQRKHRDGHLVDVSVSVAPVYNGQGQVIGTMVTVADNSRRKQAERALRESEANLRLAMDAAQMGMWDWECDSDRFACSDGMKVLFGRPAEAPHEDYRVLQRSLHADDREHFQATMRHAVRQGTDFAVDYRVVWPDGTVHWLTNRGQVYRGPDGRARRVIGMAMDISDRKLAEQRIAHMAHHDALTGLPNRVLLRDRIQQAIAQARRNQAQLAVLFIDLDRFKTINDSLGHELGDRLLQSVASRILVCVREGDTVSRVGGDEFVIVIPGIATAADASAVAAKILEVLGNAFHLHGNDLHVAASIGISLYPSDGEDAETLMRNADTAMYHAKDTGRGNFQFFTQHMNVAAQQRLQMETALRRALENREFELEFQPLFDLRDRSITGFEALLRWRPPGGHRVPPAEFIGTAEESGLIVPIGDWVLREALRQARTWQVAGRELMVAVNVSANQLSRPRFAERLRRLIDESGIDPRLVELEVTESVIIEGAGEAREAIDQAAALGVGIAIDDFGTGYSGLAYLKRLPIDTVKIDQSFVRDLTVDPDDAAIVTAIVAMARSLGVDVVAEGVETEDQLAELQRLGCHRAQGFLLARPMGAAAVQRMLARERMPVPDA